MAASAVSSVLIPMKFLILMTHLLAILVADSCKEDNVLAGVAKGVTIGDNEYTLALASLSNFNQLIF